MDCLVKLYDLPSLELNNNDVTVRRAMAYEKTLVLDWIKNQFTQSWSDECALAFNQQPISCFIATQEGNIIGFACFDCTQKNFFGPLGVDKSVRSQNIGTKLLLASLHAMKNNGYAYAIIGGCDGLEPFYAKQVNAIVIEGSTPGIYSDRLIT